MYSPPATPSSNSTIVIDPSVKYIEVGKDSYSLIKTQLTAIFGSDIDCDSKPPANPEGYAACVIRSSCGEVNFPPEEEISMTLGDQETESSTQVVSIRLKDLFIDSQEFNPGM